MVLSFEMQLKVIATANIHFTNITIERDVRSEDR